MTTLLYVIFFAWAAGVVLFGVLMTGLITLMGGREKFTIFYNAMTNSNLETHHIDWAVVLAVFFWPSTIVNMIYNSKTAKTRTTTRVVKENNED